MTQRANLRVCARCEWIWKRNKDGEGCPKCEFVSYGARYVYGVMCYQYAKTQKPWMDRKVEKYRRKLWDEIEDA